MPRQKKNEPTTFIEYFLSESGVKESVLIFFSFPSFLLFLSLKTCWFRCPERDRESERDTREKERRKNQRNFLSRWDFLFSLDLFPTFPFSIMVRTTTRTSSSRRSSHLLQWRFFLDVVLAILLLVDDDSETTMIRIRGPKGWSSLEQHYELVA